jgi:Fe-S cluster biogenesis protein NfuA
MINEQGGTLINKVEFTKQVEEALMSVRPALELHSGGLELVDADSSTGLVTVRLLGMCVGCPMADMTIKSVIEETLMHAVPGVTGVISG